MASQPPPHRDAFGRDGLPYAIPEVDTSSSLEDAGADEGHFLHAPSPPSTSEPPPPPSFDPNTHLPQSILSEARRVRFSGHTISDVNAPRRPAPILAPHPRPGGPTVTVRAPPADVVNDANNPAAAAPSSPSSLPPSSPSLRRSNHPGPLGLADRIPGYRASPLAETNLSYAQRPSEEEDTRDRNGSESHDESDGKRNPNDSQDSAEGSGSNSVSREKEAAAAQQQHEGLSAEQADAPLAGLSVRELDKRGLNGQAIVELRQHLERLENGDAVSIASGSDLAGRRSEERPVTAPETSAPVSGQTSGTATPSDGSYNPIEDSDLDHVPILPGEVDGMPAPSRHKTTSHEIPLIGLDVDKVEEGVKSALDRARSLFHKRKDDSDPEKAEEGRGDDGSGPTNRKSVPVQTSTGIRGTEKKRRPSRYERQAARLVRSHRLMMGLGGGHGSGSEVALPPSEDMLHPDKPVNKDHLPDDSNASTPDATETAGRLDARPVANGGVLGNLLMLYEQQQRQQQEDLRVAAGAPTEAGSEISGDARTAPSSDLSRSKPPSSLGSAVPGQNPFGVRPRPLSRMGSALPSPTSTVPMSDAQRKNYHPSKAALTEMGKATKSLASSAAKDFGMEYEMEERPRAARSGAGVAGALVATAGNLVGAVSPVHAQLGPNPYRPGFTLNRYLLPEMDQKTMRRTAKLIAQASGPVPKQRRGRTPGSGSITPGGWRTPGGLTTPGGGFQSTATTPTGDTGAPSAPEPSTSASEGPLQHHSRLSLPSKKHSFAGSISHPQASLRNFRHHGHATPDGSETQVDYFGIGAAEQLRSQQKEAKHDKERWQRQVRKRAKRTKKEEIYITLHVAAILQRQEFLLKLARALMMFGAPTHRIETQIQSTARVLEVNCRCIYLPSLMLIAFSDDMTHTSDTRFIKQPSLLDLAKLTTMHSIYWNVIHDKIGVDEASKQLDDLMRSKPIINRFWMVIIGGFCSSFICAGPMGFNGSFVDCLLAFPLGACLVFCQSIIKAELFSNVFEVVFAGINSFIAAAAYQNGTSSICYAAVTPASIVLILPGMHFLQGSLELQSKAMISGSVRLVYGFLYSLFLGFGLSVGSALWTFLSGSVIDATGDSSCQKSHDRDHWYMQTVGIHYAFLCVPGYAICLSLRNYAKPTRKEFVVMVCIAIGGWCVNHFAGHRKALSHRQDFTAMLGSMAVGITASIYGALFDGRSFVVAVPGILYLLPSGWAGGGLLEFANTNYTHDNSSSVTANSSIASGFQVAESLLSVAIGLTVGLFAATVASYTLGGRRARTGGMFSF